MQKERRSNLQRVCTEKLLVASWLAVGVGKAGSFLGQQTSVTAGWLRARFSDRHVLEPKTQGLVVVLLLFLPGGEVIK